jgi:LEA14-like dessication related protein
MKKKIFVYSFILTFALMNFGCSWIASLFVSKPEILGIKSASISSLSFTEVEITTVIEVMNDNSFSANLKKAEYEVYMKDTYIGKGTTSKSQEIKSNGITLLDFPLRIKYSDLPSAAVQVIKSVLSGGTVHYQIEGDLDVEVKGVEVTLSLSEERDINIIKK